MSLKEWNERPGMVTAEEWCRLNRTTMDEMAEAQERHEAEERERRANA